MMAGGEQAQARILIVDDEPLIAWDLSASVAGLGHAVCGIASDADSALRLAERERPDVILMDVRLGRGRDGIEAAREIRAQQDVPIIYVTAYGDAETRARMAPTRPVGVLGKPVELDLLRDLIEQALHH